MSVSESNSHEPNHDLVASYADGATFRQVPVVTNQRLSRSIYKLSFQFPELASTCRPGQFFMVRLAATSDPLIGRPFALFDSDVAQGTVEMVFAVAGNLTRPLAEVRAGEQIEVWGPLGNGFSMTPARDVLIVAGGIGYTPFLAVANAYLGRKHYGDSQISNYSDSVTMCFGARTAEDLVSLEELQSAGANLYLATDDGSKGFRGYVTKVAEQWFQDRQSMQSPPRRPSRDLRILACGPVPMMRAAAELAARMQIPCEVSLETPMACGIGICFSCVAPVKTSNGWDYRRTCVEGPVFDGQQIHW